MRGSIGTMLLAGGLLALGACGTLGQPSNLTLAELAERCQERGGTLTPTNRQTGEPRRDFTCTGAKVELAGGNAGLARNQLNTAIDRSTRNF
jgi:hypothetical protein